MAREIRMDPRPRGSGLVGIAVLLLPVALVVLALIMTAVPGTIASYVYPLAGAGGFGVVVWIAYQAVRLSRPYRCPECGDRLEGTNIGMAEPGDPKDSGPVHYICPRCDVEWDRGWRWHTGGGDGANGD